VTFSLLANIFFQKGQIAIKCGILLHFYKLWVHSEKDQTLLLRNHCQFNLHDLLSLNRMGFVTAEQNLHLILNRKSILIIVLNIYFLI